MIQRDAFQRYVSQALTNLFDYVQLEQNPLCALLPKEEHRDLASPGRALQNAILRGIEALKPAGGIPPTALQWRIYNLLHLRYVEGMMVKEIMNRLQLGDRQLRRENQRAVAALSSLLWDEWLASTQEPAPAAAEVGAPAHFAAAPAIINFSDTFESILSTLQRMPGSNWHNITLRLPENLPPVLSDRVLLRQTFITSLHHYLSMYAGSQVTVEGRLQGQRLRLTIRGSSGSLNLAEEEVHSLQQLFRQVNNTLQVEPGQVTLELPVAASHQILVIDDDDSTIHLFRRYLTGLPYTLVAARDGSQAVKLAEQTLPDLILLDVLMPNLDGWEILQQLKASDVVGRVPVIVCSAWNEPEIARSLGANGFLHKNILQQDLIDAIQRCLTSPGLPGWR